MVPLQRMHAQRCSRSVRALAESAHKAAAIAAALCAALLVPLAISLSILASAPAAAVASGPTYVLSAMPTASSSTGYYILHQPRGRRAVVRFQLSNQTGSSMKVKIAPVDSMTAQFGGTAFSPIGARVTSTGKWLKLKAKTVKLPPRSTRTIRVTVSVPKNAKPGDHLAGLAAWTAPKTTKRTKTSGGKAGARLTVVSRQIVAVQVVVPGAASQHMTIKSVKPMIAGRGVYLAITQVNDGQLFTKGSGVIHIARGALSRTFSMDTTVPGTSWTSPVFWKKSVSSGSYDTQVVITYDNGQQSASWRGRVTIGAKEAKQITDRVVGATAGSSGSWKRWVALGVGIGIAGPVMFFGLSYLHGIFAARAH